MNLQTGKYLIAYYSRKGNNYIRRIIRKPRKSLNKKSLRIPGRNLPAKSTKWRRILQSSWVSELVGHDADGGVDISRSLRFFRQNDSAILYP